MANFFKVILPRTLEEKKLKIPAYFVRKFGDELSDVATLTVPNGRVWQVGVVKEEGKIWFVNGWREFVHYHSIGAGHLLVFQFRANSNFHVVICDMSACEIQYLVSGDEEPGDGKQNLAQETDDEESVEIMGSKAPHSSFSTLRNRNRDYGTRAGPSSRIYTPSQKNQDELHFGSVRSQKGAASRSKLGDELQSKKIKVEEMAEINKYRRGKLKINEMYNSENSEEEQSVEVIVTENEPERAAQRVRKAEVDDRTKLDHHDFLALLEEMGISVSAASRHLTMRDRLRAIHAARLFKPKNDAFLVILPSYVGKAYVYVYVPADFAQKCLNKDMEPIKIQDCDGREYSVKIRCHFGYIIQGGWSKFVEDKNLKKGDICVFELMRKNDVLLKVSVFHV